MSRREALLAGVSAASSLQRSFALRERLRAAPGAIDVTALIVGSSLQLQFRPLEKLLGACVSERGTVGVLVNSERPHALQRFTAAHELGHACLDHQIMTDRSVGSWAAERTDFREVAADSFASELLMPKWLIKMHAKRLGWNSQDLSSPSLAYQLALRLGVSFEAIRIGLLGQQLIPETARHQLQTSTPKELKLSLLQGTKLLDPWADAWQLQTQDTGGHYSGGPNDLLVIDLQEPAASGYRWDLSAAEGCGFEVRSDEFSPSTSTTDATVGAPNTRRITFAPPADSSEILELHLRRSWSGELHPEAAFRIRFDSFGKERAGLSRYERIEMGLSAAA